MRHPGAPIRPYPWTTGPVRHTAVRNEAGAARRRLGQRRAGTGRQVHPIEDPARCRVDRRLAFTVVDQHRRIAAYGVCRDDAGHTLLVRASIADDIPGVWGLPGGGIEHGEHPRAAVAREFVEETGLAAEIVGLRAVQSDLLAVPHRSRVTHTDRVIYDVRVAGGELRSEVGGTSDLARWVPPAELPELWLMPYVSRALGLPPRDFPPVPPARPVPDDGVTRVQRFAAYALVTDPDGRLLLTLIAPRYPGAGSWHLPGGGVDFGEEATTGLVREIAEETNQHGRVTALLDVTHYHNPGAMGPERRPIDWHTIRSLFRVVVDEPTVPSVIEATGGSTAAAAWYRPEELSRLRLNDFARSTIAAHLR